MAKKAKPVEEAKQPEKSEEQKLAESLDTITLNEPLTLEGFKEKIEACRSDLYTTYSKSKRISNILIPIVGLLMVGSLILFTAIQEVWGKILGGVIIGLTLAGVIVYYILAKSKLPNKSANYIRGFAIYADNYVYSGGDYSKQTLYFKKRYAVTEILPDRVYKDIVDIASRNLVSFDYKEHTINAGELALYKPGVKKAPRDLVFVGRYLTFTNDYHFEDRYIINIKGKTDADLPTDFEDLSELLAQNKFHIYGKADAKFEKDLGKELINDLKSIDCTGCLLNVNIVIWAGRTSVYLSYDDGVVAIPLNKPLDTGAYQKLKKDIHDLLEILVK